LGIIAGICLGFIRSILGSGIIAGIYLRIYKVCIWYGNYRMHMYRIYKVIFVMGIIAGICIGFMEFVIGLGTTAGMSGIYKVYIRFRNYRRHIYLTTL
jgi:hypothetical protein